MIHPGARSAFGHLEKKARDPNCLPGKNPRTELAGPNRSISQKCPIAFHRRASRPSRITVLIKKMRQGIFEHAAGMNETESKKTEAEPVLEDDWQTAKSVFM
jgi:hypothetical protein